jgi:tetratricopeptide (TPR) repeat protein
MVYGKQGRLDEAITQYNRALAINAGCAEARYNLGNALLQKKAFDQAIDAYEGALAIRPDFAEVHYNLAIAHFYRKDYARAVLHCDKAVTLGYKADPALVERLAPYR